MASLRRRLGALILFMIFWVGLAVPAALAADAFTVRGVEVDVTAASVAAAKDQAIGEAQRAGLRKVLERLAVAGDLGRLSGVDGRQFVRDFSVEQERASAVRYIATFTVRYNPAAVKKLLRDSGIKFAEPRPRPVAVVPVVGRPGGAAPAWIDAAGWRSAWAGQSNAITGLVPVVVASGEATGLPPIESLIALDPLALGDLAARSRGGDVLVAVATHLPEGLEVRLGGAAGLSRPYDIRMYPIGAGGLDAAYQAAAADVIAGIETLYKQQNLLAFDRAVTLVALAPLRGFDDWLAIRERLGRVPQVRHWDLVSLGRDEAGISLNVLGDPDHVRAALAGAGLSLELGDGVSTLRLVEGRR